MLAPDESEQRISDSSTVLGFIFGDVGRLYDMGK